MVLTLYTSTANPKQLDKTNFLTQIGTARTLAPTQIIDELTPIFVIDYNAIFLNCNYVYCNEFNKFYFAKKSIDTAGKMIFTCVADSLHTWHEQIKNCNATVIRNEAAGTNFVKDDKLPIDENRFFITGYEFPDSPLEYKQTNNKPYLLITNG